MTENNKKNTPPFYLCTGFHHSGTSLIAQTLANNGINMGHELMGASFSNPLGHVEDMPAVRLHDHIFAINGTDWRYADNGPLIKPNWLGNYIHRYIKQRVATHSICGVKDPRAVYFLKDWHLAYPGNMRFVLIYRHWGASVNSLFNRASRHLINSTHPILANKANIGFWQNQTLAFEMWRSTNERLLSFYLQHQDKCLLISQEGFCLQPQNLVEAANKLQLPEHALLDAQYKASLMTNKIERGLLDLVSQDTLAQLDDLWSRLEANADIPAKQIPEWIESKALPSIFKPKENQKSNSKVALETLTPQSKFDLSSLSWSEAFGFIVRIPPQHISHQLFESVLSRPFTTAEHYFTLAKIAHKNELFWLTKLCKMRAMQIASKSWKVENWQMFAEDTPKWFLLDDSQLPQVIPFSLRPVEELFTSESDCAFLQQSIEEILTELSGLDKTALQAHLIKILMYRCFARAADYMQLFSIANNAKLLLLAELCLFKALRMSFSVDVVMAFGDLYLSQGIKVKAYQCFEYGLTLNPDFVPLLVRMADANLALGEKRSATRYFNHVQNLAPNHPAVKRLTKRFSTINDEGKLAGGSQSQTSNNLISLYTMPKIDSYEQVVRALRDDEKAGEELDRYNLCLSFIQRRNKQWLIDGMQPLSTEAADWLVGRVYKHWQKLWPKTVLDSELGSFISEVKAVQHIGKKNVDAQTLVLHLMVTEADYVNELFAFIANLPQQADIVISCTRTLAELLTPITTTYQQGKVCFNIVDDKADMALPWTLLQGYDIVCQLHTNPVGDFSLPGWRLQLLYCLLGSTTIIEKTFCAFAEDTDLGLVLAPYHPNITGQISWADELADAIKLTKELDIELSQPLLLYPCGGMLWFRPKALSIWAEKFKTKSTSQLALKLMPDFAAKQGYRTLVNTLL